MKPEDKSEFARHMTRLCACFDVPPADRVEAYWQAFAKYISIGEFERMVDFSVGPDGPQRLPSTHKLWLIRKDLRAPVRRYAEPEAGVQHDEVHRMAQLTMMRWLMHTLRARGGKPLPESALQAVIARKNEIVQQFRDLRAEHDPEATEQRYRDIFTRDASRIVNQQGAT